MSRPSVADRYSHWETPVRPRFAAVYGAFGGYLRAIRPEPGSAWGLEPQGRPFHMPFIAMTRHWPVDGAGLFGPSRPSARGPGIVPPEKREHGGSIRLLPPRGAISDDFSRQALLLLGTNTEYG